jgi:hypothetical protein
VPPDIVIDVFEYVINHWDSIATVMYALHALALAIINLTQSPREGSGRWHRRVYRSTEVAAGLITPRSKE